MFHDDNLCHTRMTSVGLKIALLCFKDHSESASLHPAIQQAMSVSGSTSSGTTLYRQLMIGLIAVYIIQRTVCVRFQPRLGTFVVMCDFLCMEPCCCMTIPQECVTCHLLVDAHISCLCVSARDSSDSRATQTNKWVRQ